ncbi:MAG: TolC family protein [Bacteroidaceae bacterium]|nr:TolC family protein [Bacteroidaceae bacterium]
MKKALFLLTLIFSAIQITAQEISYGLYMERVLNNNIALTAKRMDIEISDAAVENSRVYNDPSVALTYTNNEDWSKGLGQGIELELSRTFTFGVRRSRIDLAESERRQAVALLEEYMRNFRADATIAYLEHLRAKMLLAEATEIHSDLCEVAANDSLRYLRGDIAKSDWLESRMAQGVAKNAMLAAEGELRNSAIKLGYYMGDVSDAAQLCGTGSLEITGQAMVLEQYTQTALQHRADLVVALGNAEIAVAAQKFNKAQRRPELDVVLGATYNIADPDFTTIKAGVAVPLKFSNLNKGARLIVTAEVMQAYNNFCYATKQSETFSSDMLNDMQQVVESKRKAYEMGEIPFLDYLIVQRNESEMRGEYIDALFGKAVAWVELQRAVGIELKYGTMQIAE